MSKQAEIDAVAKLLAHFEEQAACDRNEGHIYDHDAVAIEWPSFIDEATVEVELGGRAVAGRIVYLTK